MPVPVETGVDPLPDEGQELFVVVPPAPLHDSSPELLITLQAITRFIVIETVYGPTPPEGYTLMVEDWSPEYPKYNTGLVFEQVAVNAAVLVTVNEQVAVLPAASVAL